MSTADLTTVPYIYKSVYSGKKPENLASRERVLLSLFPKEGGFTGDDFKFAIQVGNNQAVSATFTTALANKGYTSGKKLTLTRKRKYGIGSIDEEAAAASGDDKGAFVRLVTSQMDSTLDELGHRLAVALYGDGSGAIGQVASVAAGVITLTYPDDVRNFNETQSIQANPTKTGASGSMRAGTGTVTVVDEDAGTVTYSGTITSIAAGDYLYSEGDYDGDIQGLAAWIPDTAPTSGDSFCGIDRSSNPQRLAGWRVTTTTSIEEGAKKLAAKIRKFGGRPKHLFLSPMNWNTLQNNLETKVMRDQGGNGVFGFEHIVMATPAGMVRVYADPECPPDRGYLLDLSTFKMRYLGDGVPHIIKGDGLRMVRHSDADALEYRFRYWCNVYCTRPVSNGVLLIS